MSNVHYFGIRHHGPGSSQRLMAALQALQPQCILVEGPADCSALLPMLAANDTRPPVALLAYTAEDATQSVFYPFAEYSPEYQATLYAIKHSTELAFIDVPVNIQLALQAQASDEAEQTQGEEDNTREGHDETHALTSDPIAVLANLAGYEDGEAWWNDLIEQNHGNDLEVFNAVSSAMAALRESINSAHPAIQRDLVREAYMRLEIAKAKKHGSGPIAVVCGAWHVPALQEKHTAKSDRELIKTLPAKLSAKKLKATWVPWTSARLSSASGYGAGVTAPMWYQHLWQQQNNANLVTHWLVKVTEQMRLIGQVVSTASVIEATRLCQTLAAVRGRPSVGFEEIREAVVACLCFGEAKIWQQIEAKVLLGAEVGEIPADAPLIPLIEDLQQQQKKFKLKPEALPRDLSLDLRSETGEGKSVLLHRLNILDIPWGMLSDSGKSRGTFRENWRLTWQPEYAVKLVEHLVYGSTIAQAANTKMTEQMRTQRSLSKLASYVNGCLEAQLDQAASIGITLLEKRAAQSSDCSELLESIPSLIEVSRYGTARKISLGHIEELIEKLTVQAAISIPYACRNLDDDEASHYHRALSASHHALLVTDWNGAVESQWWKALSALVESSQTSLQLAGLAARLMYQADKMATSELELLLGKMLSAAVVPADAARYFDGFFSDAVDQLLYDDILLSAIEHWLVGLDETAFVECLPLFRRIFASLDAMERKRLIDRVLLGREQVSVEFTINERALQSWPQHLAGISTLLNGGKQWQI